MPFDGDSFNKFKTKATDSKIKSLSGNMKRLIRKSSPLRGFAVKGKDNEFLAVKGFNHLVERLLEFIKETSLLSDDQREHFLTGEKFQIEQKGPCGPVTQTSIQENALDPIIHPENIVVSDDVKSKLIEVAKSLSSYYGNYCRVDLNSIKFDDEGRALDSTRVRGFPYHARGTDCDEEIIRRGGSDVNSALKFFLLYSQLVCFPGGRIQGKPYPGPAKVRIIMIPCVFYQYFMNGLVSVMMRQLKSVPSFAGGNEPYTKDEVVLNMISVANRDGYKIITLDFSSFDKRIIAFLRIIVGTIVFGPLIKDCPEKNAFLNQFEKYVSEEYQFLGSFERVNGRDGGVGFMPNQLTSGIKNTQQDGSAMNAISQGFAIQDSFNDDIRWDLSLELGDDAGIPVRQAGLDEFGYEGVIEKLAYSFAKMGFVVHPKKKYPNTDLCFLQKIYVPELDIKGAGTGARSIASFLFKEKYGKKIPGIKSYAALEIVAQITILSNAYALQGIDLRGFSQIVADAGLEEDEGLRGLLQQFNRRDGDGFFKYVIHASGATLDQVLDYMDATSYDHTGLSSKLQSSDYTKVFPILEYLVNSEVIRKPVRIDPAKLFDPSNVVDEGEDSEDLLDED